ncbi:hypothetical protein Zmor_004814 [Zophobas morio]|uniref:Fcf2 pre-rRNA processing C-terminal domain-containing protein n=2 Tax=Zophobas morio TaxID=2755281 RepID=A0AA38IRZ2_9CUCU|nr:hypothetical protein Zmor_004814 [Zophobas morio]
MDFIIDTTGSDNTENKTKNTLISRLLEDYEESLPSHKPPTTNKKKEVCLQTFFDEMGWSGTAPKTKPDILSDLKTPSNEVQEALKKSVLTEDFEKKHEVPPLEVSEKRLKKQRKKESELTKGKKWYGLPATEMTDEVKRDLEILQMRSVLDPKRFYKKNDSKVLPKYFQIGKVLDSPLDYYNARLTKKERKKTLVDELLADAEFTKYNKRKYKEIIQEKQKTHYKAWRQAKRLKKKK